jgi:hypothetical protein
MRIILFCGYPPFGLFAIIETCIKFCNNLFGGGFQLNHRELRQYVAASYRR